MVQSIPTRRALIGGAGMAAVAVAIPAIASITPAARSGLFADRLAVWNDANARFLHAANVALLDDEQVDALCEVAGNANRALLDTPAPNATALLQKLKALTDWAEGADIPSDIIGALSDEAAAILTIHGEA